MANGRDDRPLEGGGHRVDATDHDRSKAREADRAVSPTKGHNLVIWVFVGLLLLAIVIALVGVIAN